MGVYSQWKLFGWISKTDPESIKNGDRERKRSEVKIQKNLHVNSSFECVYTEVFFFFSFVYFIVF